MSLDIRGQFTTMDANLLYCLTQTFVSQPRLLEPTEAEKAQLDADMCASMDSVDD